MYIVRVHSTIMCCHVSRTVRVLVPLDRRLCSILVNTGRALVRRPKYFEISGNIGFCGKARGLAPKGGVACLAKQKQELQSVKWSRTVCSIPVPNIDFTNSLSPGAERCGAYCDAPAIASIDVTIRLKISSSLPHLSWFHKRYFRWVPLMPHSSKADKN